MSVPMAQMSRLLVRDQAKPDGSDTPLLSCWSLSSAATCLPGPGRSYPPNLEETPVGRSVLDAVGSAGRPS